MKKISFCLPNLAAGGAERTTVQIANGLAARGYRVDMVLLSANGPYLSELSASVRVVDLRVGRARYSIFPLARYIRKEKPDVLISSLLNIPAILARALSVTHAPIILTERSLFSSISQTASSLTEKISFAVSRYLYNRADRLVAVSRASADDLVRAGIVASEKVQVIYNPVVSSGLKTLMKVQPDHVWLKEKHKPVILSVGRLAPEKNYDILLAAISKIPEVRLIILGEGPERGMLEQLSYSLGIFDRVSMPGFVQNPFAFMARSDVFVLCSKYEGLPGALIQAMACGVTPIATNSPGGIAEILGDELRDNLVSTNDVVKLAEAIRKALTTPVERTKLIERAELFSEKASIDEYEVLVCDLLRKNSSVSYRNEGAC